MGQLVPLYDTEASRQVDDAVSGGGGLRGLVPVFPAGNGGAGTGGAGEVGVNTVMAPSNAKAALSVGASMSADTSAAMGIGRLGTVGLYKLRMQL
jgi:hypothetical protein